MQTFTCPIIWKFIYRYGNLVITPLLLLYALSLVTLIDKNLIVLIPFLLSLFILYFLNKSYIKDIESISGGIFDGRYRGLMKVCDGKNKLCIGFFDRLTNSSKLVTLILSKVDKKIYDKVIKQIQSTKIKPDTKNK